MTIEVVKKRSNHQSYSHALKQLIHYLTTLQLVERIKLDKLLTPGTSAIQDGMYVSRFALRYAIETTDPLIDFTYDNGTVR